MAPFIPSDRAPGDRAESLAIPHFGRRGCQKRKCRCDHARLSLAGWLNPSINRLQSQAKWKRSGKTITIAPARRIDRTGFCQLSTSTEKALGSNARSRKNTLIPVSQFIRVLSLLAVHQQPTIGPISVHSNASLAVSSESTFRGWMWSSTRKPTRRISMDE